MGVELFSFDVDMRGVLLMMYGISHVIRTPEEAKTCLYQIPHSKRLYLSISESVAP